MRFIELRSDATIVGIPSMEDYYIGGVPRLRDETLPAHLQDG